MAEGVEGVGEGVEGVVVVAEVVAGVVAAARAAAARPQARGRRQHLHPPLPKASLLRLQPLSKAAAAAIIRTGAGC